MNKYACGEGGKVGFLSNYTSLKKKGSDTKISVIMFVSHPLPLNS